MPFCLIIELQLKAAVQNALYPPTMILVSFVIAIVECNYAHFTNHFSLKVIRHGNSTCINNAI